MENEIDIPKVPLSRTEQYLTKIVKELSGSDEEVEIPKTTLSRVEMYLKAIIDLLAEAAVKKPITVKGTVESYDKLPPDATTGDLYFVKNGDKFDEYVYTDKEQWDQIGDTGVDLTNYVKHTDFPTPSIAGVVAVEPTNGLTLHGGPLIGINHPNDDEIINGRVNKNFTALTLDRIPQVVNYYVDGKSLEMDEETHTVQIHHPTAEEISAEEADLEHQALTLDRVKRVAEWYGLNDQNTLKETYATKEELENIRIVKEHVGPRILLAGDNIWDPTNRPNDVFLYAVFPRFESSTLHFVCMLKTTTGNTGAEELQFPSYTFEIYDEESKSFKEKGYPYTTPPWMEFDIYCIKGLSLVES